MHPYGIRRSDRDDRPSGVSGMDSSGLWPKRWPHLRSYLRSEETALDGPLFLFLFLIND